MRRRNLKNKLDLILGLFFTKFEFLLLINYLDLPHQKHPNPKKSHSLHVHTINMAHAHQMLAATAKILREKIDIMNQHNGLYHPVVEGHESEAYEALGDWVCANYEDSSPEGSAALLAVDQAWLAFETAQVLVSFVTARTNNIDECAQA